MDGAIKERNRVPGKRMSCVALLVALLFCASAVFFGIKSSRHDVDRNVELPTVNDTNRDGSGWKILRDTLVKELSPIDPSIFIKLSQPLSAEWKALQWLVVSDGTKSTVPTSSLIQRFGLVATYTHFGLQLEATKHECEWMGVICDGGQNTSNPAVTELNFTGQSVTGTIPNSLSYISPFLTSLDISTQRLVGTIPHACHTQWNNLTYLNLQQNHLTRLFSGSANTTNDAPFWTALQFLSAKDNLLSESVPESLSAWTNLRHLDLRGNGGLTGPLLEYVLPHWTAIESLELAQTSLTGTVPDNLSLPHLTTLAAQFVPFSGTLPKSLATATNLQVLSLGLSDASWTGTLPESYAAFTDLRSVSLAGLKGVTGSLPASWGNAWTSLSSMDLTENPSLTGPLPTTYGQMTELRVLRLSITGINGTIPTELGQLTKLEAFSLFRAHFTGTMPWQVCSLRSEYALGELEADCADNAVVCSSPDCCTVCARPTTI